MNKTNQNAGHTFLAHLGKKRLRPGGIRGTSFLLKAFKSSSKKHVLEVGCNMATTAIELIKKYKIKNYVACDLDPKVLEKASINAEKHGVSQNITFKLEDATSLSFPDNTFDIIINEAMLTMLSDEQKMKALSEYYRVLKPGGVVLTHDVVLLTKDPKLQKEIIANLSRAIHVHVKPHTIDGWKLKFIYSGFEIDQYQFGPMSLLNPWGLIRDEGIINTLRILKNARKPEHKEQFNKMYQTFKTYKKNLGYIVIISKKPLKKAPQS